MKFEQKIDSFRWSYSTDVTLTLGPGLETAALAEVIMALASGFLGMDDS